ncbi:MAG TPA: PPOX class F420-dependent oxidoreductase [Mycobacteriales bacterium]|nr:PPOX class F420-dependent oxidoreductase [Mycobacteriales bacterium]
MATPMTPERIREFLSHGRRTGKLATTRYDGRPHVAPVWFILDGDDIVFMTGAETVKGKTLQRDPRAALVVDLEEPPYAFIMVDGQVTLSRDLDEMLPLSIAIARRYVAADEAEAFGRRNAVEGELLARLRPEHIVAMDDISG